MSSRSFLNDLERIATRNYEPKDDDIVCARLRTLGVQEHKITFNDPGFNNSFLGSKCPYWATVPTWYWTRTFVQMLLERKPALDRSGYSTMWEVQGHKYVSYIRRDRMSADLTKAPCLASIF